MVQKDTMQKKIDKEWADGNDNSNRRNVSSSASNKRDAGKLKAV